MKVTCAIAVLISCLTMPAAAQGTDAWKMVWSDEFDGTRIDASKWGFDVDCWGGGNEERQCYTPRARNAHLENGRLIITARHERVTGPALPAHLRKSAPMPNAEIARQFSSARLTTKGKKSWQYGKIEIRARLPQGQGTWPAIWMLPEKDQYGGWAASGEIDILEAVNLGVPCPKCPDGRENTILGTLHFGGKWPDNTHKGDEVPFKDVLDGGFHTYSLEWHAGEMIWRVDGQEFARRQAHEWWTNGSSKPGAPFDQPFYLILNLAIGGKLAEGRGLGGVATDDFPKRMEIDWVRVWQNQSLHTSSGQRD